MKMLPPPRPGKGEVLIQVHAAAVTPTEFQWAPTWTTRSGQGRSLPLILGHEFSGTVAAVAPGVTVPPKGEVVYGLNDWFRDGAQAEYCVALADEVEDDFIWKRLEDLQANMFEAGPVAIKFAYFGREAAQAVRPLMSTRWVTDSDDLRALMDHARAACVCGCYRENARPEGGCWGWNVYCG